MAKSDNEYLEEDGGSETSSARMRRGGNANETDREFELLRTWEEIGEIEGTLQEHIQGQSEANKRKRYLSSALPPFQRWSADKPPDCSKTPHLFKEA